MTINRPDVVGMIEAAANRLTADSKTEVVPKLLRYLDKRDLRSGSLFGTHPGSAAAAGRSGYTNSNTGTS